MQCNAVCASRSVSSRLVWTRLFGAIRLEEMARLIDHRNEKSPPDRWNLLYAANYPLSCCFADHSVPPTAEIDALEADIAQNGLRNPVFGRIRGSQAEIHPGKCRVAALRRLGWDFVPAILVWDARTAASGPFGIPISAEDAASLLDDDFVVTAGWRNVTVHRA